MYPDSFSLTSNQCNLFASSFQLKNISTREYLNSSSNNDKVNAPNSISRNQYDSNSNSNPFSQPTVSSTHHEWWRYPLYGLISLHLKISRNPLSNAHELFSDHTLYRFKTMWRVAYAFSVNSSISTPSLRNSLLWISLSIVTNFRNGGKKIKENFTSTHIMKKSKCDRDFEIRAESSSGDRGNSLIKRWRLLCTQYVYTLSLIHISEPTRPY